MIMQDRAKRTMFYHDLGKDAKINHVLDKNSMVAIAFFWETLHLILNYSTRFSTGEFSLSLDKTVEQQWRRNYFGYFRPNIQENIV